MNDEQEKEIIRLTTLADSFHESIDRFDRLLNEFQLRCSQNHSQIQRDLGRLDGRSAGISAVISAVIAGVIAWIFKG